MKKPNSNTESVLGKMLILTFLLGFFLLFTENRSSANTGRQYAKVVSEITNHNCQAEIGPNSKTVSFNPNLVSVEEVSSVSTNKYLQIQVITARTTAVQFKDAHRKFNSIKSDIFRQLIKFVQLKTKSQFPTLIS